MLFNSLSYAIFLPIVFFLFWLSPKKIKWMVLLAASYYYYMSWGIKYCVWIILTTVVSYLCARMIEKRDDEKSKKLFMVLPIVFIIGTLVFFKYFNFLSETVTSVLRAFSLPASDFTLKLIMPLGISFYSFQSVGYIVDVYNGKTPAQKHFGKFALFISFFPHVLSGPIARANDLMPQLEFEKKFDFEQASYGVRQLVWGFYKKVVVSGLCAYVVNGVYDSLEGQKGFVLICATVFYAFQIYCDFSGYSDIAIGSAKILGIDLMTNFKTPYMSQSIKEFWGRWHISLSTWFRDYIYIPLGGNRKGNVKYIFNIIITFLVSGLWHGAAWTFIVWGLLHGVLQVIETYVYKIGFLKRFAPKKGEKKILCPSGLIKLFLTFALVCFTWIFFRANTFSDAIYIVTKMFSGIASPLSYFKLGIANLFHLNNVTKLRLFISLPVLVVTDMIFVKVDLYERIGKMRAVPRWLVYIAVLLLLLILAPSDSNSNFIYFQF
ncbi:MAG: MBOAT family protein [Clostridia bacterium]|nr:MBOAT family protein [Clostridia bacterium]